MSPNNANERIRAVEVQVGELKDTVNGLSHRVDENAKENRDSFSLINSKLDKMDGAQAVAWKLWLIACAVGGGCAVLIGWILPVIKISLK